MKKKLKQSESEKRNAKWVQTREKGTRKCEATIARGDRDREMQSPEPLLYAPEGRVSLFFKDLKEINQTNPGTG